MPELPLPYPAIWKRLMSGGVVPFLGAGASLAGQPKLGKWDGDDPKVLPSGSDLAQYLAHGSAFPSEEPSDLNDLAKVSSYYADMVGRSALCDELRGILTHQFPFGALHQFIAAVPANLLIISTNYDTLLERAFQAAGRPYDLVVYSSNDQDEFPGSLLLWRHGASRPEPIVPREADLDLSERSVIYKMHGTVVQEASKWDSFVITEEDYVDFLSRVNNAVPPTFAAHCSTRSFLFLGYGLRDWNLRVVLKNLISDRKVKHWAIQWKPSSFEQALWQARNVQIFDVPLDEFTARMKQEVDA